MKRWYLSTSLHATTFCAALVFLSLSLFATIATARDSTAGNAEIERGTRTPKIDFIGNKSFSSEELLQVISSRRWRWFSESGSLNPDALYAATDDLAAFYCNHGFLGTQVDSPQIESADQVVIRIDEGTLFRFGSIAIEGRLVFSRRDVESQLTMRSEQPFVRNIFHHDILALADFYADRGFAFGYVDPKTKMDSERHVINVRFFIKPGDQIHIDQITISGNTTTPEHVIRAALQIHEHELYSPRAFRESKARLDQLGLFSGTQITTEPSARSDEINVKVTIVEKSKV